MSDREDLVLCDTSDNITTLTLNMPRRLNGWTMDMMMAMRSRLADAAKDPETKVVILTGADPYYCAGVNLSAVIKLDHPAKLHAFIIEQNQSLFDLFIDFPKPIIIAANGPAIGASVTSATLCDALIASERASFSTPFAKLGVTPEGCSSEMFPTLMGEETAWRMLGKEGWQPTGEEAHDIGLATHFSEHENLLDDARALATEWIEQGYERSYRGGYTKEELNAINARESIQLADAFLGAKFLRGQFEFLWSRNKRGPAMMFLALLFTRPVCSQFLPES